MFVTRYSTLNEKGLARFYYFLYPSTSNDWIENGNEMK